MELEAIDQKVRQGQEPAPFAMAEAGREIQNWQCGGAAPQVPSPNKVRTRHSAASCMAEASCERASI